MCFSDGVREGYVYTPSGQIGRAVAGKGQEVKYRYNSRNQLIQVRCSDGQVQENRYDGEQLRCEMQENERLLRLVYHKGELLYEGREGGKKSQTSYQLGHGVEGRKAGGEISYYYLDEQLSTVLLTHRRGEIQSHYQYDAFGVELEREGQGENQLRYTGRQYDTVTEQYYLRARYYNPVVERFMQEDVYQGVDRFWPNEKRKLKNGELGTRNWSDEQRRDILNNKVPKYNGEPIEGHHKYKAIDLPQLADDPSNIYPATNNGHFWRWHGGNYQNDTNGVPNNFSFEEEL